MEQLEKKVHELLASCKNKFICIQLQEINALILTEYSIQIDDRCFYPIEVEAYFYDEDAFPDNHVH